MQISQPPELHEQLQLLAADTRTGRDSRSISYRDSSTRYVHHKQWDATKWGDEAYRGQEDK
jgi:hypothetical protein